MSEFRRLVKIFLGSPGDLQEERKVAKSVVDEVNGLLADKLGCQVDLVGWEDTVSGAGRPQEIINRELDRCELFVGMIWKRWGTAPDVEGKYTSGFEEEFRRSMEKRQREGRPEISMYVKDVEQELLRDPGDQLKKVVSFRKELVEGKEILYESFSGSRDFEVKFRRCIVKYITNLPSIGEDSDSDERSASSSHGDQEQIALASGNPFSPQGLDFLRRFIGQASAWTDISETDAIDVARFRLLGGLIRRGANDDTIVGVHDANLMFKNLESIDLGFAEYRALLESGLQTAKSETTPLWRWYSKVGSEADDLLIRSSLFGGEAEQVGAIEVMRLIGLSIDKEDFVGRGFIISRWLVADKPNAVKIAALGYLSDYGREEDQAAIRAEFDRNDRQTVSAAVNAAISISLRDSRDAALSTLLELRPVVVSKTLIKSIFSENPDALDGSLLVQALEQPNDQVRCAAAIAARGRGLLTESLAEVLVLDSDVNVRLLAIKWMGSIKCYSEGDAKAVLVKSKNTLLANSGESEKIFKDYMVERLVSESEEQLLRLSEEEVLFEINVQLALAKKNFPKWGGLLRKNVDDRFSAFLEARFSKLSERHGSDAEMVRQTKALKGFVAKGHVERAVDLICGKSDPADLGRVRVVLVDEYVPISNSIVSFLGRFGEWRDVALIVKAIASGPRRVFFGDNAFVSAQIAATSLLKLSVGRVPDLLKLEMPGWILNGILLEMSDRAFSLLENQVILKLLANESDMVRKMAAIKCVRTFHKVRLSEILSEYFEASPYFYNAVHWLDLGCSLPPREAKAVAGKAILTLS